MSALEAIIWIQLLQSARNARLVSSKMTKEWLNVNRALSSIQHCILVQQTEAIVYVSYSSLKS